MDKWLKDLIAAKQKRAKELREAIKKAETAEEVRNLAAQLEVVEQEEREAKEQLQNYEARNAQSNPQPFNPAAAIGMTPVAGGEMNQGQQRKSDSDPYATLEYRKAFKAYVQTGEPIPSELRDAGDSGTTVAEDIGAIIPTTLMNELIKKVSGVYGTLYSKVRKLNIRGGVAFPISAFGATFKWINDGTVSEKQKVGDAKDKISFSYYIGEIRVATSLLSNIVSLDVFEDEIVNVMVEAYLKAMDTAIIAGSGTGQPTGITVDTRVTGNSGNIIEFTEEEFGDWTQWRKKLFSKVPLAKRGRGEFAFPASTVESYLLTMKDANGRPLFREATDLSVGTTEGRFFGRNVQLVEPDIIKDFDTAANGDVIGVFWVPNDYAINTNLQFGMKRYFDENTNEWVNKALTVIDGKILDVSGCYLLKKKVSG